MRCALVLFSNAAFKGIFRVQVLESAGIDRFCHLMFSPANLAGISKLRSVVVVGLQMWEIASAISKPGALCQASCAGHQAAFNCAAVGGR